MTDLGEPGGVSGPRAVNGQMKLRELNNMKLRLIKTQNGWIVTDKDYLTDKEMVSVHVFETMRGVTNYLLEIAGESVRDDLGRFRSRKEA